MSSTFLRRKKNTDIKLCFSRNHLTLVRNAFPSMMNSFQIFAVIDLNWTPCTDIKGFRMESEKFLIISVFPF